MKCWITSVASRLYSANLQRVCNCGRPATNLYKFASNNSIGIFLKRLAIIGMGSWGSRVSREALLLLKERAVDSVALCDIDKGKIEGFKRSNAELLDKLDGVDFYQNVDDVIKSNPTYAHICTFNNTHFEVAKKMVLGKIPFILEKPVSDRMTEVEELEKLCRANKDVIAKNGLIFRFDNSMKEIKRLYESGALGRTYFMRFSWEFSRDYMEGVDIVWDLMPHLIDMFSYVTGERSHFVSGMKAQFRRINGSELGMIVLETDSGVRGIFNISWFASRKNRLIEIFGDKKVMNADVISQSITLYDAIDMTKSETVNVAKNNTIRDELTNLIADSESKNNTVNNIELGFEIARYLDQIDKRATSI